MQFYERFSAKLQCVLARKSATRKLLSTGAATLALTASLGIFTAFQEKPLPRAGVAEVDPPATLEQGAEAAPRGLSRQRQDFDKALGILAKAAAGDDSLTGYFTRVRKRVRGESASPEAGPGVRVVKRERKGAQPVAEASVPVADQPRLRKVWAEAKDLIGSPMGEDAQAAPAAPATPAADAAPAAATPVAPDREPDTNSTGLTVGDMTFAANPAIERWVNYYTASRGGRQTMQIGLDRSGSYLHLARAEFRRLGLPEDLVWLAHVESVWQTTAMSPAAAGGLWQFIPRTATDYGLTVSREYDERLDPAKQTQVAAAYLRDLHTIFGDWALAMAAYNCGEPRVMGAIVKNGRADFWELHEKRLLPRETLNYVPKILAAIAVASQAESYGFSVEAQREASFAGG